VTSETPVVPIPSNPETEADHRVIRDVEARGWHVIRVPEQGNTPGWAFSIGLHHGFAHPEIIVFGLPLDVMQNLIDRIGSDVARGVEYAAHSTSNRIIEGYTCDFRPVARCWYEPLLGYACWFYGGDSFPVVQCLWPDHGNRLPNHPDFDGELISLQPLLEHESPTAARIEALLHSLDVV
jgi:hypothetical protein